METDDEKRPGVVIVSLSAAKNLVGRDKIPSANACSRTTTGLRETGKRSSASWGCAIPWTSANRRSIRCTSRTASLRTRCSISWCVRAGRPLRSPEGCAVRFIVSILTPRSTALSPWPRSSTAKSHRGASKHSCFSALSGLALLIAMVGLYATLAQFVAERVREIGIRLAPGARRVQIVTWLARRTANLILMAIVLGLIAAAISSRAMAALLLASTWRIPSRISAWPRSSSSARRREPGCRFAARRSSIRTTRCGRSEANRASAPETARRHLAPPAPQHQETVTGDREKRATNGRGR